MTRDEFYEQVVKRQHCYKHSLPLYECPKCGQLSVCRDQTITFTTYPTKYKYECLKEYNGCGEYSEVM